MPIKNAHDIILLKFTNMKNIQNIFKKDFPQNDDIYNCLPKDVEKNKIKKIEIETYSERAKNFKEDKMLSLSPELKKIISPIFKISKNDFILEIAGGDGRFAFYLIKNGYHIIESDISPGSVQKVKEIAEKNNFKNTSYAIIDAENLPFKDNSIGAVFMVASLHHLPNPKKALKEINRVLKKDGLLLILREPASWQYWLFGPIFWIIRKFLRRKNKNAYSLADDQTFGFSQGKLLKLLKPFFKDIEIKPVHYCRKIYTNWIILK